MRPGERTKEQKKKLDPDAIRLKRWVYWAVNGITETQDVLNAFWDALPPEIQRKYLEAYRNSAGELKWTNSINDRNRAVYEHFDKVGMVEALRNLAKNQIEDYIYGRLGSAQAKATRRLALQGYWSSPVGVYGGKQTRAGRIDAGEYGNPRAPWEDPVDWFFDRMQAGWDKSQLKKAWESPPKGGYVIQRLQRPQKRSERKKA